MMIREAVREQKPGGDKEEEEEQAKKERRRVTKQDKTSREGMKEFDSLSRSFFLSLSFRLWFFSRKIAIKGEKSRRRVKRSQILPRLLLLSLTKKPCPFSWLVSLFVTSLLEFLQVLPSQVLSPFFLVSCEERERTTQEEKEMPSHPRRFERTTLRERMLISWRETNREKRRRWDESLVLFFSLHLSPSPLHYTLDTDCLAQRAREECKNRKTRESTEERKREWRLCFPSHSPSSPLISCIRFPCLTISVSLWSHSLQSSVHYFRGDCIFCNQ